MGSSSNKYFNICPNRTIYSLGKERKENLDNALSGQQKCSSASNFFLTALINLAKQDLKIPTGV